MTLTRKVSLMKKGGEIMSEQGESGYKPSEKTKIVAEYLKKVNNAPNGATHPQIVDQVINEKYGPPGRPKKR